MSEIRILPVKLRLKMIILRFCAINKFEMIVRTANG